MTTSTSTTTQDDLSLFEADFSQPAAGEPAAPAVPAYLASAARRRAEDAERGDRAYTVYQWIGILGLVVSLATFGLVAYHNSEAQLGESTSVSTTP